MRLQKAGLDHFGDHPRHLGRDRRTIRPTPSTGNGSPACGLARPPTRSSRSETTWRIAVSRRASVWASGLGDECQEARLSAELPKLRAPGQSGRAPSTLRGLPQHRRRRHHRDRPPAGRRDPVGLVRARVRALGSDDYGVLGTLPHSGKVRGVLAEKMDAGHLIEAMDAVLRRLGGTPRVWRTDRLATVIVRGSGRSKRPSFGGQALQRRRRAVSAQAGNGEGSGPVLRPLRSRVAGGGPWEPPTSRKPGTSPRPSSPRISVTSANVADQTASAALFAELADAEPLLATALGPVPGHDRGTDHLRRRQRNGGLRRQPLLGAAPDSPEQRLLVRNRLGTATIDVVAPSGAVLVAHRLAPAGSGGWCAVSSTKRPSRPPSCRPSPRRDRATRRRTGCPEKRRSKRQHASWGPSGVEPVVDLSVYDEVAR